MRCVLDTKITQTAAV